MNVNINEHLARVLPWELVLTIDGEKYPVKEISNADVAELERLVRI